jgi:hypothetical protein
MHRPKNPGKSAIFTKHSCDRLRLTNSPASDKFMGGQKGRLKSLFPPNRRAGGDLQRLTTCMTMLTPQMSRKDIAYLTTLLANVEQDLRELKERI